MSASWLRIGALSTSGTLSRLLDANRVPLRQRAATTGTCGLSRRWQGLLGARRCRCLESDLECGADADLAPHFDSPGHGGHQVARDREAEANAEHRRLLGHIRAVEPFVNAQLIFLRHPDARVG